jgi:hypothetical protein
VKLSPQKITIGATTTITEVSSGIELEARVDTGAGTTSLHCIEMEIPDESSEPFENVGKTVRLLLENRRGDRHWVTTKIVDYSGIHSALGRSDRYFVGLVLRCHGVEKETIVTLVDRSKMGYHLLLGRNFLADDFLVDVGADVLDVR